MSPEEIARLKKAAAELLAALRPPMVRFGEAAVETGKAFGKLAEQLTKPPNRGPQ